MVLHLNVFYDLFTLSEPSSYKSEMRLLAETEDPRSQHSIQPPTTIAIPLWEIILFIKKQYDEQYFKNSIPRKHVSAINIYSLQYTCGLSTKMCVVVYSSYLESCSSGYLTLLCFWD